MIAWGNLTEAVAAAQRITTGQRPGPPEAPAPVADLCDKCHRGHMDEPCTCTKTCPRVYCDRRYEIWDGTTCPIAYTAEYRKQPVPAFEGGK